MASLSTTSLYIHVNFSCSGKLSVEAIQVVFEELRKKGELEFRNWTFWIVCFSSKLGLIYTMSKSFESKRVYKTAQSLLLLTAGNLEWMDKNKTRCLIMWRRPEEWGKLIYQWVRSAYCLHASHSEVPTFTVTFQGVYLSHAQLYESHLQWKATWFTPWVKTYNYN